MLNLKDLNPSQALAATHSKGPALVLAGPGSGKTFLIVNRIRYLIEHCQVAPNTILVITFTRAAAKSMQQRFTEAVDGRMLPVTFGTFHAIFFQILKTYDSYNDHSLLTYKDKIWYLGDVLDREYGGLQSGQPRNRQSQNGQSWQGQFQAGRQELIWQLLSLFGFHQNNPQASLTHLLPEKISEQEFQRIFTAYQHRIKTEGKIDFDDMAVRCLELFRLKPEVLTMLRKQYRYILIDEYQDTNAVQDQVIGLLAAPDNELFAVGDDDQAIYGFRGSAPDIMRTFEQRYPGARRYLLETNYRSTGQIVTAAGKVIGENKKRFSKKITSYNENGEPMRLLGFEGKRQEYKYLTNRIKELAPGIPYAEMAVITRTNKGLERIAETLRSADIPCHVKEKRKSRYRHFIVQEVFNCLAYALGESERTPDIWRELGGSERKRQLLAKQVPYAAFHFLRKGMGYEEYLRKRLTKKGHSAESGNKATHQETDEVWQEWEDILNMLADESRNHMTIREWRKAVEEQIAEWEMQKDTLDNGKNSKKLSNTAGVQLLTMHGSKGLEFTYVCLPDVNEGMIPGRQSRDGDSIEEERRMLYVGMTRAKKILDILYLTGTKEYPRLPSRFLNPILQRKETLKQI